METELHICIDCDTSFLDNICWGCGKVGIPISDVPTKIRQQYGMVNAYDCEHAEDEER